MRWSLGIGATVLAIATAAVTSSARTYEHARAVGQRCSTCHTTKQPGPANLNPAGRYFLVHRTLDGYVPGVEGVTPGPPPEPGAVSRGEAVFVESCAVCHGSKGEGTPAAPRPLTSAPEHGTSQDAVVRVIRDGIDGTVMVPFKGRLTDADIAAVAQYVISLRDP